MSQQNASAGPFVRSHQEGDDPWRRSWLALAGIATIAITAALSGCATYPDGPAPILSRLPADSSHASATGAGKSQQVAPLSAAERKRYDEIDQQVMRDQSANQARANAAYSYYAAPAPYYYQPAPVTVYGGWGHPYGYYGDYYGAYGYYGGYGYGGYYGW
jgi:hypothetical protein